MKINNCLVVTPVFNGAKYIRKTINSILLQSESGVAITYCVVDGASEDNIGEVIAGFQSEFSDRGIEFLFISEKDHGMYDALAKGFESYKDRSFDFYCYINSGDFFSTNAFLNLQGIFSRGVDWVTGINIIYNTSGDIIGARLPGIYPRSLIRSGVFGLMLPCIQQESTFWSSSAHQLINFDRLRKFRLAGDYFIWQSLASKFELKVAKLWLSGFTVQPGQLSEVQRDKYFKELKQCSNRGLVAYVFGFFVGLTWLLPDSIKCRLFGNTYI